MSERDGGLPLEQFIQALTSQLDRAQNTMALKARAGLPLTFAVKDLTLDLRTHVEMVNSVVRIRPAGPGEGDASTLHLALTTITRPMIEENTYSQAAAADEPSIKEALGKEISDEEQRRLEWAGIHTVSQLRSVQKQGGEGAIERVADIPVNRLRAALARASEPLITHVALHPMPLGEAEGSALLRIHGHNLVQDGQPAVRINGELIPVLRATPRELIVAALPHHTGGNVTVETAPGSVAQREFRLPPPPIPQPQPAAPGEEVKP
jgi:hypothetical protein